MTREPLRSSTRSALFFGATVLVLAAVIFGVSALSRRPESRAPEPSQTELTDVQQSRLVALRGREALDAGETTEAAALFEEALRLNPNNTQARQGLGAVAGARPGTDAGAGETTGTTTPPSESAVKPSDPVFATDIEDLARLLPAEASGFALGTASINGRDAAVSGSPVTSDVRASRALWTVHDRGSAKDAEAFIKDVSRSLYPKDAASPVVDGAQAYFGTDGARFATVAYVRGRYVFEVVLTGTQGAPKGLAAEARAAAGAFPDGL